MSSAPMPTVIADRLEVVARLHDRGLGEPWHCRDPQRAGGPVMVKLLRPVGPTLPPALDDLLTRAKLTRHADVLRVYDYGVWNNRPYVVYEFFEGSSLGDGLDRARETGELLPLDLLHRAFEGIVAALNAAHRAPKELLHLGVDPACVIMRRLPDKPLKVKVLDFGLAAWADPDPEAPRRSARALQCTAPEAYGSAAPSPRSDVFSLGALLREMLATPPPSGDTLVAATMHRRREDVSERMWAEIVRATELDPAARHASIQDFHLAVCDLWTPRPSPAQDRPAQAPVAAGLPSLYERLNLRALPAAPPPAPPVSGPMPELPRPRQEQVAPGSPSETIVLVDVAARRAPSPWDLGALRDERAEAEELAAAAWFKQRAPGRDGLDEKVPPGKPAASDATFVMMNDARPAHAAFGHQPGTAPAHSTSGASDGDIDATIVYMPSQPSPGAPPWPPVALVPAVPRTAVHAPSKAAPSVSPVAPARGPRTGWGPLVGVLGFVVLVAVVGFLLLTRSP